jgi:hypothetical protein
MPAVGLGLYRSRVNGGSRSLSLSLPPSLGVCLNHILYGYTFIRLFEKNFDRLEMVECRARVPSPGHDMKKAYEQLPWKVVLGRERTRGIA